MCLCLHLSWLKAMTPFPCPISSKRHSLSAIYHLSPLSAVQPTLCLPSGQAMVSTSSRKATESGSHTNKTGFLQRYRAMLALECTSAWPLCLLGRRPKATHYFVSLNKMVLLVYLSSTDPSLLLQPNHTMFPKCVTKTPFEEPCLLLKSCCSEKCCSWACICVHICGCVSLYKALKYGMHYEHSPLSTPTHPWHVL